MRNPALQPAGKFWVPSPGTVTIRRALGSAEAQPVGNSHQATISAIVIGAQVQTYGRKKTAVAVALCKTGNGLMKLNGCPMDLITPEVLKMKAPKKPPPPPNNNRGNDTKEVAKSLEQSLGTLIQECLAEVGALVPIKMALAHTKWN